MILTVFPLKASINAVLRQQSHEHKYCGERKTDCHCRIRDSLKSTWRVNEIGHDPQRRHQSWCLSQLCRRQTGQRVCHSCLTRVTSSVLKLVSMLNSRRMRPTTGTATGGALDSPLTVPQGVFLEPGIQNLTKV